MKEYLIVDGYNIINAWPELNELKEESYEHARMKLIETLVNYQGATNIKTIIVFDAHQVKKGLEKREKYNETEVVYTKEHESADMFIERIVGQLSDRDMVYVATSDWIEQSVILQRGAFRISARELYVKTQKVLVENINVIKNQHVKIGGVSQNISEDVREVLEKWRRGKT